MDVTQVPLQTVGQIAPGGQFESQTPSSVEQCVPDPHSFELSHVVTTQVPEQTAGQTMPAGQFESHTPSSVEQWRPGAH